MPVEIRQISPDWLTVAGLPAPEPAHSYWRVRCVPALLIGLLALPGPALASPGRGDNADGATVERGAIDTSLVYDRFAGGPLGGEDLLQIGATVGATERLRLGGQVSLAREPGGSRQVETVGAEALYHLGKAGPFEVAVFATYDIGLNSADTLEGRLILEHGSGPYSLRLNLIGSRELASGQSLQFGYALAADFEAAPGITLGLHGFGEFGSFNGLLPHGGHALGPTVSLAVREGIDLRFGYLFALGNARQDAAGQMRLGLEFGY